VRQTEELARRTGERESRSAEERESRKTGERAGPEAAELAYLEERFRQALGTRVELVRSRQGGRLVIHFYSGDELQGLYEAICER
jgi:ParB family chromosome partitioning protein